MELKQDPPSYPIASVDNALQLLLLLRDDGHIRLADAAARLGVARSTAHRLLEMLLYRGFVTRDDRTRTYVPGPVLLDVGLSAVSRLDVRSVARPLLVELRDETHETVHLATLELPNVLFVECIEGDRAVRVASRVGQSLPAHCTSAGKVLLAGAAPAVLQDYLRHRRLQPMTARSITQHSQLRDQLAVVGEAGYAVNVEESEDGLGSVAAPIADRSGRAIAAVSVAAPVQRCSRADLERLGPAVRSVAERIGELLP